MVSDRVIRLVLSSIIFLAAPGAMQAQAVLLEIRPHVGDTIAMRLDQTVEMRGTTSGAGQESPRTMATAMEVFTRAVALRSVRGGTIMQGIADSVAIRSRDSRKGPSTATRRLGGRTVEMRIGSDGAVELLTDDPGSDLRAFFAEMPATLPAKRVKTGERWTREMSVPIGGNTHTQGSVRATFTLDSLGRNGDVAYISMKGTLTHSGAKNESGSDGTGQMSGAMQLDRRLGWITESRALITLRSMVARQAQPLMKVETRITQWLRAMPAK